MKNKFNATTLILAFFLGGASMYIGNLISGPEPKTEVVQAEAQDMGRIQEVYDLIRNHYVLETDSDKLITGAIDGMVNTLDDPFTTFMSGEETEQLTEMLGATFSGIGVEVSMVDGNLTATSPIKGAPAERVGIRTHDVIVSVDGESLEGVSQLEAVSKIRGEKGTIVTLEIRREGVSNLLTFEVERDEIPITTVHSEVKEQAGKQIGYLQITSFSERTAVEFKENLTALEEKGIDGLVLDVRGNGGGYLGSVEDILSLLVTNELPIVQIEHRDGARDKIFSTLEEPVAYPMVVLIDESSASASEILASALAEIADVEVIGQTSFGKGTVQSAIPLAGGSSLKLTQFKWLTPLGNWINETGIEPTIEVAQPDFFFASPIQFEEELKQDTTSEQVSKAQLMLLGVGFDPGRQDGYFDQATVEAVKGFQQAQGLQVTGTINEETVDALHTRVVEEIRNPQNDKQLERALEVVVE